MAVLLISSEFEEVIGLSHRVLVMRGGRIVAKLEGDEIEEGRVMDEAFGAGEPTASRGLREHRRGAGFRTAHVSRRRLSILADFGIVISFVVLFIVLSIASEQFLTRDNLLNILDQWAPVGIIAFGGTLVLIAGGFDLSVGAIFAISGVVAAKVANSTSIELGVIAGIATGLDSASRMACSRRRGVSTRLSQRSRARSL